MRPGAAAQPAPQPQYTGSKRVPQWVFVSRLFNQVILQDRAALAASGSSTKTSGLQRMLLIGASLLLFFTAIALHCLLLQEPLDGEQCRRGGRSHSARRRRPALAWRQLDSLQRLETLRQALEQLTAYRVDGHPFSMGWLLYRGR